MIKCYLFDLDDTLIDSSIYHALYEPVMRRVRKELNISEKDLIIKLDSLKIRKNKIGNHDTGDACKRLGLLDIYYEELEKHIKIHHVLRDDVTGLFEHLRKNKKHIAIASDSMRKTICLYLDIYGLSDKIDFVFSAEDAGCKKDDGKYWEKLIEEHRLKPEECMMIGDNEIEDVEIPRRFGFKTFHIKKEDDLKRII